MYIGKPHSKKSQIYNEQIKDEPGNYGAGFLGWVLHFGMSLSHR